MPDKRDRGSARYVEIINLDDPEVAPLRKKRARMDTTATPSTVPRRNWRKSSDGSSLQQLSENRTAKPPETANVVKKKTKEAKNIPEDIP